MAVSYIPTQVFKHNLSSQLCAISHVQPLPVLCFDHLPPSGFLCALKHAPEVTSISLKMSLEDWKLFKDLKDNSKTVLKALKALSGRKKAAEDDEE
jgi:hypothetical protein